MSITLVWCLSTASMVGCILVTPTEAHLQVFIACEVPICCESGLTHMTSFAHRGTGKCDAAEGGKWAQAGLSPWNAPSWNPSTMSRGPQAAPWKGPTEEAPTNSSSWVPNRASRWHRSFKWHPMSRKALSQASDDSSCLGVPADHTWSQETPHAPQDWDVIKCCC